MKQSSKSRTFWQKWRKIIILVGCVLLFSLLLFRGNKPQKTDDTTPVEVAEVEAVSIDSIVFGEWVPGRGQSVLGTVESVGDITLSAELSGTIESVDVNIGDTVSRGQVLARYRRGDDQAYINYQNAVSQKEQAKLTTQNSIAQAELNVKTAERELREQMELQKQTRSQSFEILKTQLESAEISFGEGVDYTDRITKATDKFRYEANPVSSQIGRNNKILRQSVKNRVIQLRQIQSTFNKNYFDETAILREAGKRYEGLIQLRGMLTDIDQLIRQTPESNAFSITTRSGLEQEVEGKKVTTLSSIASLNTQIEGSKSQTSQYGIAILQAENRVKTAKANLELSKANATSSVSAAGNAISLAEISLGDLDIRSPFNGVISGKEVNAYQQVSPGTMLFSIINKDIAPKVIAFVTKKELGQLQQAEEVRVLIDGVSYTVENGAMSISLDPATQKTKVEYNLGKEETVPVGSIARIQIPTGNTAETILLPLSAIGFEPDGAEVLVVVDGITKRQKIAVGEIQSDGIEVSAGIVAGDVVVRYRTRVYAGQKVAVEEPADNKDNTQEKDV